MQVNSKGKRSENFDGEKGCERVSNIKGLTLTGGIMKKKTAKNLKRGLGKAKIRLVSWLGKSQPRRRSIAGMKV